MCLASPVLLIDKNMTWSYSSSSPFGNKTEIEFARHSVRIALLLGFGEFGCVLPHKVLVENGGKISFRSQKG